MYDAVKEAPANAEGIDYTARKYVSERAIIDLISG